METVIRSGVYLGVLLLGSAVAMPLGGIFNALMGGMFVIPRVGPILAALLNRRIRISVILKLIAWSISSFGMVAAYVMLTRVMGEPVGNVEWAAVASAALIVMLNSVYRILLFQPPEVPAPEDLAALLPGPLAEKLEQLPEKHEAALVRSAFVDLNITALLQLLSTFGVLLFAGVKLGLIQRAQNTSAPDLQQCLVLAFSFVNITTVADIPLEGEVWLVLRSAIGVTLLVWAVAFVGFAVEWLPKLKNAADTQGRNVHDQTINTIARMETAAREVTSPGSSTPNVSQSDNSTPQRANSKRQKRRRRKS